MDTDDSNIEGSKDHIQIVKGKRTRRQRPQSPPFNSFDVAGDTFRASSPLATSASAATDHEEEELADLANCLILLAQGQARSTHCNYNDNNDRYAAASKRLYQCKTCSRTFSSFQALGGHRASHRKPRTEEKRLFTATFCNSDDDEDEQQPFKTHVRSNASFALQLGNVRPNSSSSKLHGCAICGAEFTSGQALGGHMRRHRAPPVATTNTTAPLSLIHNGFVSNIEDVDLCHLHHQEAKRPRTVFNLDLDLNLPAPDDESNKLKQQQQQQQEQSPLVLSTAPPALVDCHY